MTRLEFEKGAKLLISRDFAQSQSRNHVFGTTTIGKARASVARTPELFRKVRYREVRYQLYLDWCLKPQAGMGKFRLNAKRDQSPFICRPNPIVHGACEGARIGHHVI